MHDLDPQTLVGHSLSVAGDRPLAEVFQKFSDHEFEYMAVVENGRCLGICSREDIGMQLGSLYGRAVFGREPVRGHLRDNPMRIVLGQALPRVLETVFSRAEENFFDDVILIDASERFLGLIFMRTLISLQNRLLLENIAQLREKNREIERKNRQMENDLIMARELQKALLPSPEKYRGDSAQGNGVGICYRYRPTIQVGGDFFHLLKLPDHSLGVLLCDVMGHGVRSALVTAMVRALVDGFVAEAADPGRFLTRLNRELFAIMGHGDDTLFVTAFYLHLDAARKHVRYGVAGHHDGLHLRRRAGRVGILSGMNGSAGPPLGILRDVVYGTHDYPVELAPDDLLLLYTDGLFEAADPHQEPFGQPRLLAAFRRRMARPTENLFDQVLAEVETFTDGAGFNDDICLVGVEIKAD